MILFPCPHCWQTVRTADERAGLTMLCPHCQSSCLIPNYTPRHLLSKNTPPGSNRKDLAQWIAAGIVLTAIIVFVIYVAVTMHTANLEDERRNAEAASATQNAAGVPREVIEAIQADIKAHNYYQNLATNCDLIAWQMDFEYIYPAKDKNHNIIPNRYMVGGEATGKTNVFGTHEKAMAILFFSWDPSAEKISFADFQLADAEWQK
jgi:hypothetical protein